MVNLEETINSFIDECQVCQRQIVKFKSKGLSDSEARAVVKEKFKMLVKAMEEPNIDPEKEDLDIWKEILILKSGVLSIAKGLNNITKALESQE